MEKGTAERLAVKLIDEHLYGLGYSFAWDRAVTRHGACNWKTRTISLSLPVTLRADECVVIDTILHEIAHATAFHHYGDRTHGPAWRREARRLGIVTPQATAGGPDTRGELAPWVGTCPAGHVSPYRFFRKPRKRYSCSQCSRVWSEAHVITYRHVDTAAGVR